MTQHNQAILQAAGEYLGLTEWPGAKHNPRIVELFDEAGHPEVNDDETPWCAAFVGAVLAQVGLPTSGKLNARSYLTYGAPVELQRAVPGDIVVLWRGSRTGWQGHVAFFVSLSGDKVTLRGGNQGNAVTDASYSVDQILGVRRADGVEARSVRPVLRSGDKGAWVLDLQDQLTRLGYTLGAKDAKFGSRTLSAVVAFQNDKGLAADGVVGDRTWAALQVAKPRAARVVDPEDLRHRSRTIRTADEGKAIAVATTAVAGAGTLVQTAEQSFEVAQRAGSLASKLVSLGPWILILAAVGLGGFLIWRKFQKINTIRIEDAVTGANDSK